MAVLAAALTSIPIAQLSAQTLTTLHSFTAGADGGNPAGRLLLLGNTLYGTGTSGTGPSGPISATVFKVNTDATGFEVLHTFTGDDGNNSRGALINSGNKLFGTSISGSAFGQGSVFAINIDGTGFTNLYNFSGPDGARPGAGLVISNNVLYGTTSQGGKGASGTIFKLNADGSGFATLYNFSGNDGSSPGAGAPLVLSADTLYGTTLEGGDSGSGTVFRINIDGTGFTNLYSFTAPDPRLQTNTDGFSPLGGLVLSNSRLYGVASAGGASNQGTLFALNIDGTGFTVLHSLSTDLVTGDIDGAIPNGIALSGKTLYGVAAFGGGAGRGTLFTVNTDGTGFSVLHTFTFGSDGGNPSGLLLSGNSIYGNASASSSGFGTTYSISLPLPAAPSLIITPSTSNVLLTWPSNASGFALQSTTNLASPTWTTNLPTPAIVNGQNTVTYPTSAGPQFFRLSQ